MPETLEAHIGANIRALRGDTTMQALGEALKRYLGKAWTRQAVWDAERGRRSFTAAELLALAEVLDVTVPQLYETSEPLIWPGGKALEPEQVDALTAGSTSDRARWESILAEVRGLIEFQKKFDQLGRIHSVQLSRLLAAARNTKPQDLNVPRLGGAMSTVVEFVMKQAERAADEWAKGPRGGIFGPSGLETQEVDE